MMKHPVLRTYDLAPDGLRIVVDWKDLTAGTSIFVPCVNTKEALRQAKQITVGKGWETVGRTGIEDGKLGVRIWRIL